MRGMISINDFESKILDKVGLKWLITWTTQKYLNPVKPVIARLSGVYILS